MKTTEILMLAGAGLVVMLLLSKKQAASGSAVSVGNIISGVGEIFSNGIGNGWRYFTDGTAIAPDGAYYKNGALIYKP